MKRLVMLVLTAALSGPAWSQHHGVAIVKSIDADKGTVMLAHEPIPSLRWPAMTMKFTARDRKVLDKLAPGKKIEFEFVQHDREYVLTRVK